jgi:hypothetical protein
MSTQQELKVVAGCLNSAPRCSRSMSVKLRISPINAVVGSAGILLFGFGLVPVFRFYHFAYEEDLLAY